MTFSSVEKDSVFFSGRNLRATLVKRLIATIFAALLAFVAFPNARGQSSSKNANHLHKTVGGGVCLTEHLRAFYS